LMIRLNSALETEDPGGELRVGHSYFLPDGSLADAKSQIERKWTHQVQQLLKEYSQLLNLEAGFFAQFPKELDRAFSQR